VTSAITTRGLTKDYGGGRGLFDLDLEMDVGEVIGTTIGITTMQRREVGR
jgi:hypothetical protein